MVIILICCHYHLCYYHLCLCCNPVLLVLLLFVAVNFATIFNSLISKIKTFLWFCIIILTYGVFIQYILYFCHQFTKRYSLSFSVISCLIHFCLSPILKSLMISGHVPNSNLFESWSVDNDDDDGDFKLLVGLQGGKLIITIHRCHL